MLLGLVGLIPTLAIVILVYLKDPSGRKPFKQVAIAFGIGVGTCIAALIVATVIKAIATPLSGFVVLFMFIDNFLVAAGAEEVTKYFGIRLYCRKKTVPYIYDFIVWGALIGFGFAALENLVYLSVEGAIVAVLRAIFAVPGHVAYGILMGYFIGKSFKCKAEGNASGAKLNTALAILVPWFIHGTYDLLIEDAIGLWFISFTMILVFTIAMVVLVFREAKKATPIPQPASMQPPEMVGAAGATMGTTPTMGPQVAPSPTAQPMPTGQPVSVGQPVPSGQPVSVGQPVPSGISAGQPAPAGQPATSGQPAPSGQPVPVGIPAGSPTATTTSSPTTPGFPTAPSLGELRDMIAQQCNLNQAMRFTCTNNAQLHCDENAPSGFGISSDGLRLVLGTADNRVYLFGDVVRYLDSEMIPRHGRDHRCTCVEWRQGDTTWLVGAQPAGSWSVRCNTRSGFVFVDGPVTR